MAKTHFGYLHHNPGNIRWNTRDKWQGLAQQIPAEAPPIPGRYEKTSNGVRFVPAWDRTGVGFFVFTDATMGLRAIARTLITYQDKFGDRTMFELFNRYAPQGDHGNNPTAYANTIARSAGVGALDKIDAHDYRILRVMLPAICQLETGQKPPYTDAQFDQGLALSGVKPPEQPLSKSRTIKGASTVTAGAAANQAAADVADSAKDLGRSADASWMIDMGNALLPVLKWAGIALVCAGIGWIVWARIDDRNKGLR